MDKEIMLREIAAILDYVGLTDEYYNVIECTTPDDLLRQTVKIQFFKELELGGLRWLVDNKMCESSCTVTLENNLLTVVRG